MKRIRWTEEERADIYERLVEVYAEGKRTDPSSILQLAQRVLPIERRRKIYSSMVYNLRDWMHQAKMEAYTRARDRKLTEVALANKPVTEQPAPQPVELDISQLFEKLFDQLAKRVASEVAATLSERLSALEKTYKNTQPVAEVNPVAVATPQPTKSRRKRITVVGLKGQQVTTIEQKYQDIDFTFFTSEDAQSRSLVEADHTILMTKFINHAVYGKYRHVPNMKHCNGGVSDLCTMINNIRNS